MRHLRATLAVPVATGMLGLCAAAPAQATDFIGCPSGHSGVATTVTSCEFAESVRGAYLASGGSSYITAYSPVTGQYYDMQCEPGFIAHLNYGATVPSVRCVGGNNAVVIVY